MSHLKGLFFKRRFLFYVFKTIRRRVNTYLRGVLLHESVYYYCFIIELNYIMICVLTYRFNDN